MFGGSNLQFKNATRSSRMLPHRGEMCPEPMPHDGVVVKRSDGVCEDLVGMAPFTGDKHDIAGPGVGEDGLDGESSVKFDANLARLAETAQQIVNNLVGIFGSRVAKLSRSHDLHRLQQLGRADGVATHCDCPLRS